MRVTVILLPSDLDPVHLIGRTVVIFDVLRATTSMLTALNAGVKEIRVFPDTDSAAAARAAFVGSSLLSGEVNTLPPPGFDLGNSPPAFTSSVCEGKTLFISTTNGTRAILAAKGAQVMYVAALANASAAARAIAESRLDVTLICSGTGGQYSMEDLLGCGAVLSALEQIVPVVDDNDMTNIARRLFAGARTNLPAALRETRGGHNIQRVGLTPDIDFCAQLDVLDIVGRVTGDPPVVVRGGGQA